MGDTKPKIITLGRAFDPEGPVADQDIDTWRGLKENNEDIKKGKIVIGVLIIFIFLNLILIIIAWSSLSL